MILHYFFKIISHLFAIHMLLAWQFVSPFNEIFRKIRLLTGPVTAFLIQITKSRTGALEAGAMVIFVEISRLIVMHLLPTNISMLFLYGGAAAIITVLNIINFALFLLIVFSWIQQSMPIPRDVIDACDAITFPFLRPIRTIVPVIAGLDLAPMVLLIATNYLKYLLVYRLGFA